VSRLEVASDGSVDLELAAAAMRAAPPALLALSLIGNALGTRQPVKELVGLAREVGASVMLDVSQAVGHEPMDVRDLDCDYLCFSGHKMMGPGGVGVLYVRSGMEGALEPMLRGGSMVLNVGLDDCELQPFPWCFEAGTPNVEGVLGLAAACRYLEDVGLARIATHTSELTGMLRRGLRKIQRVVIHGCADESAGAITSFSVTGQQAHGVARLLSNRHAIMVRSGYHCAQPLHLILRLPETVRVSVHLYNTTEEIQRCIDAVEVASKMP
jgi:cysteine desulfurase/selenocysteine lyase